MHMNVRSHGIDMWKKGDAIGDRRVGQIMTKNRDIVRARCQWRSEYYCG